MDKNKFTMIQFLSLWDISRRETKFKNYAIPIFLVFAVLFVLGGGYTAAQNSNTEQNTEPDETEITKIQTELEEQEKKLQQLREEAEEHEKNLQETRNQANSLEAQIATHNAQIRSLEGKINIKKEEIYSTQLAVRKINLQIDKKQDEINTKKKQIATLVQVIYKNDSESLVELLFKYESFSMFFDQVHARESLQDAIITKLDDLKKLQAELHEAKEILAKKQDQLEAEQQTLRDQRLVLEQQKLRQASILNRTKQEEAQYQQLLAETQAKERQIRKEIFELEEQLRFALDPSSVPRANAGVLAWPVRGYLTQGYGCIHNDFARSAYPSCDDGRGGFHNGIDIAASFGTPIKSAADGVVKSIGNSPYAYGYWLAVEHDNGLVTAYTHMSSIRPVSTGDRVEEGDVVGYMDSTGFSTGSHTHFMVYAPDTFRTKPSRIAGVLPIGATLNPFDYLP